MPGPPTFEPYTVVRQLASGPTSDLYLARHESLQREVWIKALRAAVPLSSPFATALEQEAALLSCISHGNVQGIYELVKRDATLWLVLEAVDGWTLSEVLGAPRATGEAGLRVRGAVAIALQVAQGLSHTHRAGVVHGAVQPMSVLISRSGVCKLAGFTAAFRLGHGPPDRGLGEGPELPDPAYISPEQVVDEDLSPASDVFSLGVMLYELLTGERPWTASTQVEMAQDIRHSSPPPLNRTGAAVPPALERIVQRCLEKRSDQRFASAAELSSALAQFLGTEALQDVEGLVVRSLAPLGFDVEQPTPNATMNQRDLSAQHARRGLRRSMTGMLSASALIVIGGALLSRQLDAQRRAGLSSSDVQRLAPVEQAGLLVVAEPWAHVFVDGALLETTPFATPIPLAPGVHHVRLEHPTAPKQRRRIALAPGQTQVLNVALEVRPIIGDAGAPAPQRRPPDAGQYSP